MASPASCHTNVWILPLLLGACLHATMAADPYNPWYFTSNETVSTAQTTAQSLPPTTALPATTKSLATTLVEFDTRTSTAANSGSDESWLEELSSTAIDMSAHCVCTEDGSTFCAFECSDDFPLTCENGGVCMLDENLLPVCSCPQTSEEVYTGAHCEYRITLQASDSSCGCDIILYIILLCVACLLVVLLVALNILQWCRYRAVRRRPHRVKGNEMTIRVAERTSSDLAFTHFTDDGTERIPTFVSSRSGNRMYFEGPASQGFGTTPPGQMYLDNGNTHDDYAVPFRSSTGHVYDHIADGPCT